jgi:hypothetical protein
VVWRHVVVDPPDHWPGSGIYLGASPLCPDGRGCGGGSTSGLLIEGRRSRPLLLGSVAVLPLLAGRGGEGEWWCSGVVVAPLSRPAMAAGGRLEHGSALFWVSLGWCGTWCRRVLPLRLPLAQWWSQGQRLRRHARWSGSSSRRFSPAA